MPDQRLPPGQLGTELLRLTEGQPDLHGIRDALEVKRGNGALPALPVDANEM